MKYYVTAEANKKSDLQGFTARKRIAFGAMAEAMVYIRKLWETFGQENLIVFIEH